MTDVIYNDFDENFNSILNNIYDPEILDSILTQYILDNNQTNELNTELNNELNNELNTELNNELNTELNNELNTELNNELNNNQTNEINTELNTVLNNELNNNQTNELTNIINFNYELAYERIPESLFECNMIYIEGIINNKKIKIFVDTGAQHSIISYNKAKEFGIDYLIDKRFNGMAQGVGQQEIIGRVHYIEVNVDDYMLQLGVSVLKDINIQADMLLGIDTLISNNINIDFQNKCLVFHNIKIPFIN